MKKLRFVLPLAALSAFAQGPKLEAVTSYLSLTDAQVQSIQQIRDGERQAAEAALKQVQEKQSALVAMIAKGSPDPAAVGKLAIDIEAARKQIETTRAGFREQARNVLSAEQRTKVAALQEAVNLRPAIEQSMELGLLAPAQGERRPWGPGMEARRAPGVRGGGGRREPMRESAVRQPR